MEYRITINMDNAAFDRGNGRELARILSFLAYKTSETETPYEGSLKDINGKTVGKAELTDQRHGGK